MVGLGLARALFVRHKLGLALTLAFLLIASVSMLVVGKEKMPVLPTLIFFVGFVITGFYLLAVFLHSDSDVATPGSTYPTHYFTLPVKTSELVLWPVLSGIAIVGGITFLVSFAIDKAHYDFNFVGATFVMVTLLTTMQAVFWFPVGIPYSKLVLSVSVITGLFFLGIAPSVWKIEVALQHKLYLAVIMASIAATWVGVAKARTGRSVIGAIRPNFSLIKSKVRSKAFPSPFQAQVWYEWRQQGKILPYIALTFIVIFLGVSLTNDTLSPLGYMYDQVTGTAPMASTFLSVYYPMILVLVGVFSWVVGFGMKRTEVKRNDGSFHLFFSTRPLSDENLVWAKFVVVAKSCAITWGLLLLSTLPLLAGPSAVYSREGTLTSPGSLIGILPNFITPQLALNALSIAVILYFFSCRNFIIGFWTELSGNSALRYLQPFASIILYALVASMPKDMQKDLTWLPWVLGSLVAAKYAFSGWLGLRLIREQTIGVRSLSWIITGHLVLLVIMGACAFNLLALPLQEQLRNPHPSNVFTALNIVLATLWYVPLTRILLAINSLSANRHR